MLENLDWGLPVISYLFLAGLGAGAAVMSGAVLLHGGPTGWHFSLARYGALLAPIPVAIGSGLLVLELGSFQAGHMFKFLNLYKLINLSPMSIGTWLLTVFLIASVIYAYTYARPGAKFDDAFKDLRRVMAWIMIPLGLGVAIYTGMLLGAMPSRPFWNSPVLAMLFLLSALSTGVAGMMLMRALFHDRSLSPDEDRQGGYILTSADTVFISLEILILFMFIMFAHLTVGDVGYAITVILGGSLTNMFWIGVVIFGLLIPALIEIKYIFPKLLHHRQFTVPHRLEIAVPVIVLSGGFLLRYVIVVAGQITGPVGI